MAQGDFFAKTELISSDSALIVDGTTSSTGAVELHTVASNAPVKVETQIDSNGDGVFDLSIIIDESTSSIHSQKNKIEISQAHNIRVKVTNNGTEQSSIHVTGVEIAS